MSEDGRRKLREYGIAPPIKRQRPPRAVRRAAGGVPAMRLGKYRSAVRIRLDLLQGAVALQELPRTLRLFQVSLTMSHAPRFHRLAVNDLRRESAGRGVADLCDPRRTGRRLQLQPRPVSHAAHHHGRRGSPPFLFDLLRPRRWRAAHRREEGRRRRVLELGRGRSESRRRARRDDADRPLWRRACAGCRRALYVGFAAGSGITPILSIVKGVLAREPNSRFFLFYGNRSTSAMMFLRGAGRAEGPFHAAVLAVPRHLRRGAGHPDPARPARRRKSAGAAALAGAGGKRRSCLHLRPHRA